MRNGTMAFLDMDHIGFRTQIQQCTPPPPFRFKNENVTQVGLIRVKPRIYSRAPGKELSLFFVLALNLGALDGEDGRAGDTKGRVV